MVPGPPNMRHLGAENGADRPGRILDDPVLIFAHLPGTIHQCAAIGEARVQSNLK